MGVFVPVRLAAISFTPPFLPKNGCRKNFAREVLFFVSNSRINCEYVVISRKRDLKNRPEGAYGTRGRRRTLPPVFVSFNPLIINAYCIFTSLQSESKPPLLSHFLELSRIN
jgi:hypothetical protein